MAKEKLSLDVHKAGLLISKAIPVFYLAYKLGFCDNFANTGEFAPDVDVAFASVFVDIDVLHAEDHGVTDMR